MLGARQSKAFLGPHAVRGGPPVQIRGAPPEYTVQIVNADPLYAHALQKKPGMEDLVKELGEERTCPWDGMILVTTPAGVAIASITGHASAAAIAAGGIPVGVGMNVVCEVLGASALITLTGGRRSSWQRLSASSNRQQAAGEARREVSRTDVVGIRQSRQTRPAPSI